MTETPAPPYDFLPDRFRDTPFDQLPPGMQRKVIEQQALEPES